MSPNDAPKLIRDYIKRIDAKYRQGNATEHTYRDDLRALLEGLLGASFTVTNEPKRTECGAPDYVITKHNLPIAYIEAKDIGRLDFKDRGIKEQLARYQEGLPTLVATDYLEFHLFVGGEPKDSVRIGQVGAKGITVASEEDLTRFLALIIASIESASPETITNPKRLALRMAGATRLLADAIAKSLTTAKAADAANPLSDLKENLRKTLKHDLRNEEFADIYAQTIAYGLFIARYHDNTGSFSLDRATDLLQGSSTLLHQLFSEIKTNRTDSVRWIIDQLAQLLAHTDTHAILEAYQLEKGDSDPTVHLYEEFLAAYDPDKRKKLGVYYTPLPVVRFIVQAVHALLQKEFNLRDGLANTSTLPDGKHQVQILDPATGTGTFLAEVVRMVHQTVVKKGQGGMWQSYVENALLPRLHGFELMMAPYAIAHLKLGLQLQESGYQPTENTHISIHLSNSLAEGSGESGGRWWLTREATQALEIQQRTPVMVLLGNPPYNGNRPYKGTFISNLLKRYKYEPGSSVARIPNTKWVNDSYVQFIRLAHSYISRNPNGGIVAFITPHGFLSSLTFRGMRYALLEDFDSIYTIDLHGNQRKGETGAGGDENVFEIQQGVAITILCRYGRAKEKPLASVYHHELMGSRESKFEWLDSHALHRIKWTKVKCEPDYYLFMPRTGPAASYDKGLPLDAIFEHYATCVITKNDRFTVSFTPEETEAKIRDLIAMDEQTLRHAYAPFRKDSSEWSIAKAKADVGTTFNRQFIRPYAYKPFDTRYIYYTGRKGLCARPIEETMRTFLNGENYALVVQQENAIPYTHAFCVEHVTDLHAVGQGAYIFPLLRGTPQSALDGGVSPHSLRPNIRAELLERLSRKFGEAVRDVDIFNYVYATLYCEGFRERYASQLLLGFPRIPFPDDHGVFRRMAELGDRLRLLHLMHDSDRWPLSSTFPVSGDNALQKVQWREEEGEGRVYINATQYFGGITESMWSYPIGSYRPMQKWLNDRKGCRLGWDGIRHYMRMAHAVRETLTLMAEIESVWTPPA